MPASFVMYCDLEAMITKEVKVNRGKIQNKSVHVPIAVGAITVCRPKKEFGSPPMIYMGADCICDAARVWRGPRAMEHTKECLLPRRPDC